MSFSNGSQGLTNENISSDFFNNNTSVMVFKIDFASQIVNAAISVLTIALNGFLLLCLRTHRYKFVEVVRHQLLSLCTSDLISGITPGLWCLCMLSDVNRSTRVCVAIHFIFSTSQFATVLNLCYLSARRWRVLKNHAHLNFTPRRGVPCVFLCTLSSWLLSFILHLPTLASFTTRLTVSGCVSPELFVHPFAVVYLVPLYGITLLTLNLFYLRSLVRMRKTGFVVTPRVSRSNNRVGTRTSCRHQASGSRLESGQTNVESRKTSNTRINHRTHEMQQKAFKHLLVALVVANVATLPYLGMIVCFVLGKLPLEPEGALVIDMQVLAMNSLLNPLIYGIYLKEIRTAIKENVIKMKNTVIDIFTQGGPTQIIAVRPINSVSNSVAYHGEISIL